MGRHSGKTFIVAGGLGLIGSAVVRRLREEGGHAAVLDLRGEPSVDIGDIASLSRVLSHLDCDGFVNCTYPRDPAQHARCYRVSTETFAQAMAKGKRGSIVNFASIYGIAGADDRLYEDTSMTMPLEYAEAKGAIIAMSRAAATKWGKHGIRINCVSPGGIFDGQDDRFIIRYIQRVPLGTMGNPGDVAGVVSFLLSDDARYITGQNIVVDGGLTAW